MRQVMSLIASCVVLCVFFAQASATNLTEDQVKNTCGGKLQSASYKDGSNVFGCEKQCGNTFCTYNCCTGKQCGEQGCHGHALRTTMLGDKIKLPMAAYLRLYAHQR
jgi:hypothetical protein